MEIVKRQGAGAAPSQQRTATFTGLVYGDSLLSTPDGTAVNSVFFGPGARTHWHSHERGQFLHVMSGRGLVATKGEPAQELGPGDLVWVPGGEVHWHGGGPDTVLLHIAVSLGQTTWLGEVSADEYGGTT